MDMPIEPGLARTAPARKDRIDVFGASALVVFSALLGLNQVLVKLVNAGMSPTFQAGMRSLFAIAPLLVWAFLRRQPLTIVKGTIAPGIVCGALFAGEFVLLFQALDYTSVARASVLFYTMPVWVTVFAHFMIPGETMTRQRAAGLVLAVVGVAVALAHNAHPVSDNALLGDLMALLAALFWAAIALATRVTNFSRAAPQMQLLYQLVVSAVILLAIAPAFGPLWREMTPALWGILAFQSVIVASLGFLVWLSILKIYPASDISSFAFLAPVFGVMFGWLIIGEKLSANIAAALALIGAGIFLVNWRPRRARA